MKAKIIAFDDLMTMRKLIGLIFVDVLLNIAQIASAGPFEDGKSAYDRGDYVTALRLLRPLADHGNAQAQNRIGEMYFFGQGVVRDSDEGVKWYRRAADQGDATAQSALGSFYDTGIGVVQDYSEAVKWYRKAAGQGDTSAQYFLGFMFKNGNGVSQNNIRAYMWFNLAAASSSRKQGGTFEGQLGDGATLNRQILASNMTQAEVSQAQAMSRVCQQSNYKNCGEAEITRTAKANQTPPETASVSSEQGASASARSVPMINVGGTYAVPVVINNAITLNFVVDSGASDVSIPADVVSTLVRTGTISEADFIGKQVYRMADGSTTPSQTFRIRSLKVGNRIIENVMGSVASARGELLLGQSFLRRFKSWSIDNTKHALVLE